MQSLLILAIVGFFAQLVDGALGMAYTVIDVAGPGRWDELGSPVAVG